jgi:protease I
MKRLFPKISIAACFFFVLFLVTAVSAWAQPAPKAPVKKVAMIIPFKMYDIDEFRIPKGILEKAGVKVTVVSSQAGIATMEDDKAPVDIVLDQLKVEDFDVIVFVGGYGTPEYIDNPIANSVAQAAIKQNKILAAICWAPVILAKAGVLKGKKATTSTDRSAIVKGGGEIVFESVVVDGNIITGDGPMAAEDFGQAILAKLKK